MLLTNSTTKANIFSFGEKKQTKNTTGSDFMWTHCLGWSHLTGFETEHPFNAGWKLLEGGINLT